MKAIATGLLAALPLICWGQEDYSDLFPTGTSTPEPVISNMYYSPNPALSPQEQAGLGISSKWRSSSSTALKPLERQGGVVTFVFGASQPSVVCAVMQVCDIELQKGETPNSVNAGDTARWEVTPTISGNGSAATWHIIVKAMDVGLETSLLITTNRRTYHITLKSHRDQYMARVAFTYPDDSGEEWAAYRKHVESVTQPRAELAAQPRTGSVEYLGDLDFDYRVDGEVRWKPVRVFNDGRKTIIQMPPSMPLEEVPALVVLRGTDSIWPWGKKSEEVMVNYRFQGERYVVDTVFQKAMLITGVGDNQDRVTIERTAE
ncbi:P-type conjugative transfer protein TrbG [Metapseudomonas furukawaii]|uniref:Conjugative transfer protein n=1 Tax=Metapseudomonas furukawaii TaxID=1149133 RepID=A0AAD1C671_METFU|nr:P-type conjugative transfer protein TrbG [Pseudomonas furukawaii]ELS26296.1 Conjugative transfer protein TrbG [Pseudomonas furukawaii]BAU77406.1 conjugative transfer protein [Pseudomonas furukawaii]